MIIAMQKMSSRGASLLLQQKCGVRLMLLATMKKPKRHWSAACYYYGVIGCKPLDFWALSRRRIDVRFFSSSDGTGRLPPIARNTTTEEDFSTLAGVSAEDLLASFQETKGDVPTFRIPQRLRHKVVTASDAVSLVCSGDTVCVSGFVGQGSPEAVLEALGQRYENTGYPNNLTLLFGGGPGDWETKGLNHLAKQGGIGGATTDFPPMLRRTVGAHYGQVPLVGTLAVNDSLEAWTLPLGSISRMIRAQATHSPGHITTVGIGTYVDPDESGGASNSSATKSTLHGELVSKVTIQGHQYLMYKALPINVAIIRATTADSQGNLTVEDESLLCDQKITAAAARNSGGIVIAQVKRLAAVGSLPTRSVAVPGPLVDCVVVVDEKDHDKLHRMSFENRHDPVLTNEIRTPKEELSKMPLNERKIIARRASLALKPGKVVNLGIGLPEGVASVAAEEGMLEYVTLTTEPGVFGGLPASGRNFGPAANADALVEMNQMFDFYDGGGLDMSFLGAAQINASGDVNVSRMSKGRLTGPGGFIDISQSTRNICFVSTFTAKGLEAKIAGDGTVSIATEGVVKKFVSDIIEKTFSGDEAVRRGQKVFYVTERAVFRRTADHDVIELVEIAPGIDLQRDILDQMEFKPAISEDLVLMDERIFQQGKMNLRATLFGSLRDRCVYHEDSHTMFINLFGITLEKEEDIDWFINGLFRILRPITSKKGPVNVVVNYDGFDLRAGLEDKYSDAVSALEKEHYRSVKRFYGSLFRRAKLGEEIRMKQWNPHEMFDEFDLAEDGTVNAEELRSGMKRHFGVNLTPEQLTQFFVDKEGNPIGGLTRDAFASVVLKILRKD